MARSVGVVIAACLLVALCAGVAAWAADTRDTTWTSVAKVVYGAQSSDPLLGRDSVPDDVDRTLATQAQVVLSDTVMSGAAATLEISVPALTRRTEVENVTDSNVLAISTTATAADDAARRAQVVAEQYVATTRSQARQGLTDQAAALDQPIADLRSTIAAAPLRGPLSDTTALDASLNNLLQQQSQLRAASSSEKGPVQVLAEAQAPTSPSSVSVATAAVIGAGLGLVVLLGLLFVMSWSRHDSSRVAEPS
ncbi:MAG: hypothetical protein LH468_08030 [Nocardioides sp.]|nr:hypothetical protein [Nocardioides sp.]